MSIWLWFWGYFCVRGGSWCRIKYFDGSREGEEVIKREIEFGFFESLCYGIFGFFYLNVEV